MKRLTLKRMALMFGCLVLLGVAAIGFFIASEWTYIRRIREHPVNSILDVAWYRPKEAVPGVARPVPLPSAERLDSEVLAEVAALAESKNASALLVVHQGHIVLDRCWQDHRSGAWTNSASMAKTITAILIGIAVEEGKIGSIDEPASKWILAWRGDSRRRITLRHLLQMHAGLRPMGEYDDPFSDACYLALGTNSRYVVENVPAVGEPGQRFDYTNVNFQALGIVLEAATGRRYADYLSERLWKPIGAGDAALWLDREGGSARTFGYFFATAMDWARLGLLLLHEGQCDGRAVVPRAFLREMLKPSPTEPTYGLGIWLANDEHQRREHEAPFAVPGIFYLDGRFKQRVYVIPSRDVVIVRVGENARGWEESALPNAVLKGIPLEATRSGRVPASL